MNRFDTGSNRKTVCSGVGGHLKPDKNENANSEFNMAPSVADADAILAQFGYSEAVLA